MSRILHWIHHIFNPHCEFCHEVAEANKVCRSCETLKIQLAIANREKEQLLNSILEYNKRPEATAPPQVDYESLKPARMTWNIRRQMLEAEDRKTAQLMAEQQKHSKSIEKLEKELGVEEEVKNSA